MSCRSHPLSSAVTTLTRKHTGMTDRQVQYLFHALQREHRALARPPAMGEPQYRQVLAIARQQALTDPLTDARRARVLTRLDQATTAAIPAERTVYAMTFVRERAIAAMSAQRAWQARCATRLGVTTHRAHQMMAQFLADAEQSPTEPDPDAVYRARALGILDDPATVTAMQRMDAEVAAADAAAAQNLPRRIVRQDFHQAETSIPGVVVAEAGYDARVGRLEVVVDDTTAQERHDYAYTAVPASVWTAMSADPVAGGAVWFRQVRGNPDYAYPTQVAADLEAAAPRCDACGQFADTSHDCPVSEQPRTLSRWSTRQRWSRSTDPGTEITVALPAVQEFRTALDAGPVRVSGLEETFTVVGPDGLPHGGHVSGDLLAYRENDRVRLSAADLTCSCPAWTVDRRCGHLDVVAGAALYRLAPPPGQGPRVRRSDAERADVLAAAVRAAHGAYAADWTRYEESMAEAARTWHPDASVLYSRDPQAFLDDYAAGQGGPIPFDRSNALAGMCERGSGTAFGIEIEYAFPDDWSIAQRDAANIAIGQALHTAGLTSTPDQQRYGAARSAGFADTHAGRWSFESDTSVSGGEIVSPGCYDEADTWEHLDFVCRTLTDNGAIAAPSAGLHVHVGTGAYQADPRVYAELARLVTQHEDVLYRLATNPQRGTHRPLQFCYPNAPVPAHGFADVSDARDWHGSVRYHALNLTHVTGSSLDHPEFRLFDSSLDPGVIQGQVKLATGLVYAARRLHDAGIVTARGKEPLGAHAKRGAARGRARHTPASLTEDSATTRSLLDTVFWRRDDKAHLAAIYANTKWMRERLTVPVMARR